MCGSVWEWTRDEYDALAYSHTPPPAGPMTLPDRRSVRGRQIQRARGRVLRGGSWADGADAVTTSFRMSREAATGAPRTGAPTSRQTSAFGSCERYQQMTAARDREEPEGRQPSS